MGRPVRHHRRPEGVSKMFCKFKACGKCGGDLMFDTDDGRCFQCGRIYCPERSPMELLLDPMETHHTLSTDISPGEEDLDRKRRKARRAPRRVNSMIASKRRSEEKWWARNQQVIQHLDDGKTVREISEIVGRGWRQTRHTCSGRGRRRGGKGKPPPPSPANRPGGPPTPLGPSAHLFCSFQASLPPGFPPTPPML